MTRRSSVSAYYIACLDQGPDIPFQESNATDEFVRLINEDLLKKGSFKRIQRTHCNSLGLDRAFMQPILCLHCGSAQDEYVTYSTITLLRRFHAIASIWRPVETSGILGLETFFIGV